MRTLTMIVLLALASRVPALKQEVVAQNSANPIRKVVTLLQNMQKKIVAEGEKESALFEKYMCYCKLLQGSTASGEGGQRRQYSDHEEEDEEHRRRPTDPSVYRHRHSEGRWYAVSRHASTRGAAKQKLDHDDDMRSNPVQAQSTNLPRRCVIVVNHTTSVTTSPRRPTPLGDSVGFICEIRWLWLESLQERNTQCESTIRTTSRVQFVQLGERLVLWGYLLQELGLADSRLVSPPECSSTWKILASKLEYGWLTICLVGCFHGHLFHRRIVYGRGSRTCRGVGSGGLVSFSSEMQGIFALGVHGPAVWRAPCLRDRPLCRANSLQFLTQVERYVRRTVVTYVYEFVCQPLVGTMALSCYCKNGKGTLEASIASAKQTNEQLTASIKETDATLTQTKADLKTAQADRTEAKKAVATATALREKEASAYAKESSDLKTNIAALKKATVAIEKGAGGAFLQTSTASILRQLSVTMDISSMDRELVTSFLTQDTAAGYVPQSGQIVGILKQMTDTMETSLATATSEETASIKDFDALMAAKTKEINALTKDIERKIAKIGELGVELVTQKEDLDDTTKSLMEDEAFLKDLDKNCKTKEDEWATRCKVRAEELLALADTIKILNDDDALDLFKKTLPTPSFMQLQTNGQSMKRRALAALQQADQGTAIKRDFRLDLISLALKGKKVSFAKVLSMIDDMIVLLGKEQTDDDDKKAYCEKTIDETEDDLKSLELTVSDLGKAIADYKERIQTLTEEIASLEDGIKALDAQVAEATEDRKEEHAENVETLANDNAAKELIGVAKNRLNKFYNPKLYVAPPKRDLSEEERITVNMGGTLAPTAAPGGIAGTGVEAMLVQRVGVAPPPPPETFGAYTKKGEESTGVITMLDMMVADLDKEITEIETEEKENQAEYEQFMKDSASKRASDAKSVEDKESAKADLEATLISTNEEQTTKMKEAMATAKYLSEVHGDCDWLLSNFEARKSARAGEVDSLKKGKAVLSGADYSLLQSTQIHRHLH